MDIRPHLESLKQRFDRLLGELGMPETSGNPARLQQLQREHARLAPVIAKYETYLKKLQEAADLRMLTEGSDPEFRQIAFDDLKRLEPDIAALESELRIALLP